MCLGPAGLAHGLIQNLAPYALKLLSCSSSRLIQLSAHQGSKSKMSDAQFCHGFEEP